MTTPNQNSELRRKVLSELGWDPSIDATGIAVVAQDGVVALTGTVGSHFEKRNAEAAVKRVSGVRAVAEDLTIRLQGGDERSDADIAAAVLNGLRFNVAVPCARRRTSR